MCIPQILQHPGVLQLPCGSKGGWQEGKQLGMSLELQILVYPAQELLLLGFLALGCVEKIMADRRAGVLNVQGWSCWHICSPQVAAFVSPELLGAAIPALNHTGRTFQTFFPA